MVHTSDAMLTIAVFGCGQRWHPFNARPAALSLTSRRTQDGAQARYPVLGGWRPTTAMLKPGMWLQRLRNARSDRVCTRRRTSERTGAIPAAVTATRSGYELHAVAAWVQVASCHIVRPAGYDFRVYWPAELKRGAPASVDRGRGKRLILRTRVCAYRRRRHTQSGHGASNRRAPLASARAG